MPYPLTTYITKWRANYSTLASKFWMVGAGLKNAADAIAAQNWSVAHDHLDGAGQNMLDASQACRYGTDSMYDVAYSALHWIDLNWPSNGEEYELTMEKILEAMWDGDLLRWFHFINYIDSMRAGIWNIEIYDTHLADWYRHFSI